MFLSFVLFWGGCKVKWIITVYISSTGIVYSWLDVRCW